MSHKNENKPSETPGIVGALAGEANDQLTDHAYDGIQEFDNPLPGWWKWIFTLSVLFAFPYMAFYHGGAEGRSTIEIYEAASAENARLQFADLGGDLEGDAMTLAKYKDDKTWLRVGQSVFKSNCVSCHGPTGGGLVGPNLCDESFKNIKTIEDIYKVLVNGAAAGAMPAWKSRLDQNELVLAAAYVASLRGTDPGPSAKAGEGREIPAWPVYVEPETSEESTDQATEPAEPVEGEEAE